MPVSIAVTILRHIILLLSEKRRMTMEDKYIELVQVVMAMHQAAVIRKEGGLADLARKALVKSGIRIRQGRKIVSYYDGDVLLYDRKKEEK